MISNVKYLLDSFMFKRKWVSQNTYNKTIFGNIFPIEKVIVKNGTYGKLNIKEYNPSDEGITIGNYCYIAENSHFLPGGEYPYKKLSTFPFKAMCIGGQHEAISNGSIIIIDDDDACIGYGRTILSGVHIHQVAIIAVGSIVYKDVPPYAIYSNGNITKYRYLRTLLKSF